jgi:hypothetical protein
VTAYYGQREIQERSEDRVSIRTAHADSFSVIRTLLSTGSESGMDQIFIRSRLLAAAVGSAAMLYVLDYDYAFRFVDPVQDAPLGAETCRADAS